MSGDSGNESGQPVALVTGASSGIGEAAARCLAEAGFTVVVAARRADLLEDLAKEIEGIRRLSWESAQGPRTPRSDKRRGDLRLRRPSAGVVPDLGACAEEMKLIGTHQGVRGIDVAFEFTSRDALATRDTQSLVQVHSAPLRS